MLDLREKFGKALAFAVSIGYASKDTIKLLINKAFVYESAIGRLIKEEKSEQNIPEIKSGETQ